MIEKLYELLTKVGITKGQDKVLHFIAGILLGVVGQVMFADSIMMVIPVIVGGIGKELYDQYSRHFRL